MNSAVIIRTTTDTRTNKVFFLSEDFKIMNKRVLIACEESQTVCKEFRKLGFEAYSCDIQECSGGHPEWHLQIDCLEALKLKWDLLIAHPPCTYLSNAGARFLYPKGVLNEERYKKGLEGKEFFLKLLNANVEHICVENPVSSRIFEMPKFTQEIQPYQFGHPFTKKTRLWLKGLPKLKPTEIIENVETSYLPSNTGGAKRGQKFQIKTVNPESTKLAGNWFNKGGKDRQRNRSKTFEGIAKAMAEQWSPIINGSSEPPCVDKKNTE